MLIIATYLSHDFSRARHEFSVFIARERFVSHMKSPYHYLTLLHILSPSYRHKDHHGCELKRLSPSFCVVSVLVVCEVRQHFRKFSLLYTSTQLLYSRRNSTVVNTAKNVATLIFKKLTMYVCPYVESVYAMFVLFVLGVRPSALTSLHSHNGHVSSACFSSCASKLCQLSGGPDKEALGTRISRWRGRR
jgi:hypothetical protein